MNNRDFAQTIDHTLLKANASAQEIHDLCAEAREYGFYSVCVNPFYARLAHLDLADADVKTCVVVGFPLGATTREMKAQEAAQAVANGADEIDMVISIPLVKARDEKRLVQEITAVKAACSEALLKVIIETCLLTDEEKVFACQAAVKAGADFVKTSTGFSTGGATLEDIKLMKKTVGDKCKIKASGGIRTRAFAEELLAAGADRIGASAGIQMLKEGS